MGNHREPSPWGAWVELPMHEVHAKEAAFLLGLPPLQYNGKSNASKITLFSLPPEDYPTGGVAAVFPSPKGEGLARVDIYSNTLRLTKSHTGKWQYYAKGNSIRVVSSGKPREFSPVLYLFTRGSDSETVVIIPELLSYANLYGSLVSSVPGNVLARGGDDKLLLLHDPMTGAPATAVEVTFDRPVRDKLMPAICQLDIYLRIGPLGPTVLLPIKGRGGKGPSSRLEIPLGSSPEARAERASLVQAPQQQVSGDLQTEHPIIIAMFEFTPLGV